MQRKKQDAKQAQVQTVEVTVLSQTMTDYSYFIEHPYKMFSHCYFFLYYGTNANAKAKL